MISLKARHSHRLPNFSVLEQLIREAGAISFDFFDTLFVRTVLDPEDVFDMVGARFRIGNFREIRKAAQTEAFRRMHVAGKKEITMEGIYACFPSLPVAAAELMAAEIEVELAVICPNPDLMDLFLKIHRSGKKIVLTSDMYLSASFFQQCFIRHGLPQIPVFTSADCNATKRDHGELFDVIAGALDLQHQHILHIGDNPHSDIAQGNAKGLRTYHYAEMRSPPGHGTAAPRELSLARGLLRRHHSVITPGSYQELGFLYGGPAAAGFLEWISERAREDHIDHVLFLSRDGYVLHEMAHLGHAPDLPHYDYFYGSRVAYTLAAVTEANFAEFVPFFLSGAQDLLLSEILERIAVPPPAPAIISQLGLDGPYTQDRKDAFEQFIYAYRWQILKVCGKNRRALFSYLSSLGIRAGQRVALVDVGWSGTTQEAFERALELLTDISVTGYYFCLADTPEWRRRAQEREMKGMYMPSNTDPQLLQSIYQNRAAAELFFSAPHQSVIGLNMTARGEVMPVEDGRCHAAGDKARIQSEILFGMLTFAESYFSLRSSLRTPGAPEQLAAALVSLITEQPWRDQQLFRVIKNFDAWSFTRTRERSLADEGM